MHESVKAKEIEKEIIRQAEEKGLKSVKEVLIKAGRGEGESPGDIVHIVKEHMNISRVRVIKEDLAIKCSGCGKLIKESAQTLGCPECGEIESIIISGMGFKVLEVR